MMMALEVPQVLEGERLPRMPWRERVGYSAHLAVLLAVRSAAFAVPGEIGRAVPDLYRNTAAETALCAADVRVSLR